MKTGYRGTFVIPWDQTEVGGWRASPVDALDVGSTWRWTGSPVRIDGPGDRLELCDPKDTPQLRTRAAKAVGRFVAQTGEVAGSSTDQPNSLHDDEGFVVTDGQRAYRAKFVCSSSDQTVLLVFVDALPPKDQDLWVVSQNTASIVQDCNEDHGETICFTPGTHITTPGGPMLIETLDVGDMVVTKDNGVQPIRWIGHRKMSGARLYAMPHLRPIQFNTGALDFDVPNRPLQVSQHHRILLKRQSAIALFNTDEVLVAARDLVDGRTISFDHTAREVTYIHILFDAHQIVWANGVETDSFHPANADLKGLLPDQQESLFSKMPEVFTNPHYYGGFVRRNLTRSEAAILRFGGEVSGCGNGAHQPMTPAGSGLRA